MRSPHSIHTLVRSAGADFARRVPGLTSNHGRMDSGKQAKEYPTSVDGSPGIARTPRGDGLDAQSPFCPVPGIEGQRQRQRTGQTKGNLPRSTSPSPSHSGTLAGSRQATTQLETQRGEGHTDTDRNQVSEMPGIQLDQPRSLQVLRDTLSQATGYLQQFRSTITAAGQATRHSARQILCGCRRRLPPSESVCTDPGLSKRQAELETIIGTLPDESPLKTELSTQLDSVKEKLKDPRRVKKATARRGKAEEALKQAQEALEQARLQEIRAFKELEDAKAAAAPAPPPETPPPGSVSLSSDDVAGLISLGYMLTQSLKCRDGSCQAVTPQKLPPRKALAKAAAPLQEWEPSIPRTPHPLLPPLRRRKPPHTNRRQRHAGCSGKVSSPLLRGCGGLLWRCSLTCMLAQIWLDASLLSGCQTTPTECGTMPSSQTSMASCRLALPACCVASTCHYDDSLACISLHQHHTTPASPLPGTRTCTCHLSKSQTCVACCHSSCQAGLEKLPAAPSCVKQDVRVPGGID